MITVKEKVLIVVKWCKDLPFQLVQNRYILNSLAKLWQILVVDANITQKFRSRNMKNKHHYSKSVRKIVEIQEICQSLIIKKKNEISKQASFEGSVLKMEGSTR